MALFKLMSETDKIKKALSRKRTRATPVTEPLEALSYTKEDLLSTGSTLLNLVCTGDPAGGFVKGHYFYYVGDSSSGKTWLSLVTFAEASINTNFDDYRFIYDNGEDGALMNMEKYFGSRVVERLESPSEDGDGEPVYSDTAESFYYHMYDALEEAQSEGGKPFIYVLDSENSLTSSAETDKVAEKRKAYRDGKVVAGSYGDGKAKIHSEGLRTLIKPLKKTKSILIIISQTRDNLGFGMEKKTRSGGKALKFYACLEMWTSTIEKLTKTVRGKKRQIGIVCAVKLKKNRLTGRERQISIPIYHSHGIDDVGSCVDYLLEEKHWTKAKASIVATELKFKGTRDKLIAHIESNDLEPKVRRIVAKVYNEIERECSVSRKNKYA